MKPGLGSRRPRNRHNNSGQHGNQHKKSSYHQQLNINKNTILDSTGPSEKLKGTAQQLYDKYTSLARESGQSNDRVVQENYLQHAEYYFRILAEIDQNQLERQAQQQLQQQQQMQQPQYQQAQPSSGHMNQPTSAPFDAPSYSGPSTFSEARSDFDLPTSSSAQETPSFLFNEMNQDQNAPSPSRAAPSRQSSLSGQPPARRARPTRSQNSTLNQTSTATPSSSEADLLLDSSSDLTSNAKVFDSIPDFLKNDFQK